MVTAETELGCFGMSICYDVRFPELYRLLAIKGARVLFVPVSFTKETGEEHLEMLLRARAVENGCYVIAAAPDRGEAGLYGLWEQYAHRSLGKGPGTGRIGDRGLLWGDRSGSCRCGPPPDAVPGKPEDGRVPGGGKKEVKNLQFHLDSSRNLLYSGTII